MATSVSTARSKLDPAAKRLRVQAERAGARAEAAKEQVRLAKLLLKKVHKLAKSAKKTAKLARKRAEAAEHSPSSLGAEQAAAPKPSIVKKAVKPAKARRRSLADQTATAGAAKKPRRKAADVASSVIKRLKSEAASPPAPADTTETAETPPA